MNRITVADVKASFNNRVRPQAFVRWFARPIAIYLTPPIFNAGISANALTTFRCILNLLALASLASGKQSLMLVFMFHVYINLILDCVDGNVARMSGAVSYWGKFFDGYVDRILVLLTPAAAGMAYCKNIDSGWVLIMGFLVTLLAVYAELTKSRINFHQEWMVRETGGLNQQELANSQVWHVIEQWTASFVYNVTFLSPLLLAFPGGLIYFVWVTLPVQGVGAVIIGTALFGQAWATMRRPRISIHSREAPQDTDHEVLEP